jgi:ubiquitin C-terminal hydrolase
MSEIQDLTGDNQYFCQICQAFCDWQICCRIIHPPSKLVINIDYGINKRFKVKKLVFEEIIDITNYIDFNFGKRIKYQISGICTHLGSSGSSGHYIAFCRNKSNGKWYNFNDSSYNECYKKTAFSRGNPYLLIYEQI